MRGAGALPPGRGAGECDAAKTYPGDETTHRHRLHLARLRDRVGNPGIVRARPSGEASSEMTLGGAAAVGATHRSAPAARRRPSSIAGAVHSREPGQSSPAADRLAAPEGDAGGLGHRREAPAYRARHQKGLLWFPTYEMGSARKYTVRERHGPGRDCHSGVSARPGEVVYDGFTRDGRRRAANRARRSRGRRALDRGDGPGGAAAAGSSPDRAGRRSGTIRSPRGRGRRRASG